MFARIACVLTLCAFGLYVWLPRSHSFNDRLIPIEVFEDGSLVRDSPDWPRKCIVTDAILSMYWYIRVCRESEDNWWYYNRDKSPITLKATRQEMVDIFEQWVGEVKWEIFNGERYPYDDENGDITSPQSTTNSTANLTPANLATMPESSRLPSQRQSNKITSATSASVTSQLASASTWSTVPATEAPQATEAFHTISEPAAVKTATTPSPTEAPSLEEYRRLQQDLKQEKGTTTHLSVALGFVSAAFILFCTVALPCLRCNWRWRHNQECVYQALQQFDNLKLALAKMDAPPREMFGDSVETEKLLSPANEAV